MAAENTKSTILVVDDEKVIRELCERVLRDYCVLQASTCEEALRIYENEPVDLILSDVNMPGGSGIELLKTVKELDPNAVVIIMTGFSDKEIILSALKEDADDFISKPLNLLQLRTSVNKALGRKVLKEELAQFKRADKLKSGFLSLISHKLRTPITGISLFLQNLQSGVFGTDETLLRQNIALANEETAYLGNLITDLLMFSQIMIADRVLHRSECDLDQLAAESLQKWKETGTKKSIVVDFNPGSLPPLNLDRGKIRFVLDQLLSNAFKFSGEAVHVSLSTSMEEGTAIIVISDSGIGIPPSELTRVFEKFYQIDPGNTGQIPGFGLGLFYARDFVRLHGGSITIESEPGRGTTVTLTLPTQ